MEYNCVCRSLGMSLEKQGSEGSLKCKLSEGSPN